jgi:hypothetical protein
MRIVKVSTIRKKVENRTENIRFQRAVRNARDRASLRTEHARLHGLLYEQISPALRERVLRKGDAVTNQLRNLSMN